MRTTVELEGETSLLAELESPLEKPEVDSKYSESTSQSSFWYWPRPKLDSQKMLPRFNSYARLIPMRFH